MPPDSFAAVSNLTPEPLAAVRKQASLSIVVPSLVRRASLPAPQPRRHQPQDHPAVDVDTGGRDRQRHLIDGFRGLGRSRVRMRER
jgi:hypothetical protein